MHRARTTAFVSALIGGLALLGPSSVSATHEPVDIPADPIISIGSTQSLSLMIPDGEGGAFVAWVDYRHSFGEDVYLQRLDSEGAILWSTYGVRACDVPGAQRASALCSDGAGGVIVAWTDTRAGQSDTDVYAQRLDPEGNLLWGPSGVPVVVAPGTQGGATMVSDGAGGAILAWYEGFVPLGETGIRAQRLLPDGTRAWPASGVILCLAVGAQEAPKACPDGAGGAIVTWVDARASQTDLYAQRVTSAGTLAWPEAHGMPVHTAASSSRDSRILALSAGESLIAWEEFDGTTGYSVLAHRITADGTRAWGADPVVVSGSVPGDKFDPVACGDGGDGAWIAYSVVPVPGDTDVRVQHVLSDGSLDLEDGGRAACTAPGAQSQVAMIGDGVGGIHLAWVDASGSQGTDLFMQSVDAEGTLLHEPAGAPLSRARRDQAGPRLALGDAGAVHFAWNDDRLNLADIYGVTLVPSLLDAGPVSGRSLALSAPVPNPVRGGTTAIEYVLPRAGRVSLSLHDVRGRRLIQLAVGDREAGPHRESVDLRASRGVALAPGVYLLRLEAGGSSLARRLAVLP